MVEAGGAYWRRSQNVAWSVFNHFPVVIFQDKDLGVPSARLVIDRRLASRVLKRFARSLDGMAGYCVAGLVLAQTETSELRMVD